MEVVLVTGVAGFIASRAAEMLLSQEVKVIGVDNLNDYYDIRLKNNRLEKLKSFDNFEFYKVDIENINGLRELFSKYQFTSILNLAARAGVRYSMENPHIYMSTNAVGSLNILELMREFGVKKKVLASTSSLYAGQPMPFVETLPVNNPISPYAATKKAAEVMCYTYHKLYDLDVTVLRYFTVYGPAGRPDMSILRFIKWIDEGTPITLYGDGSQSRDFTYVDDIAAGSIAALRKNLGFEIINLGGGNNPIPLTSIIESLEGLLGKKAIIDQKPFHIADLKETWADISKANSLLDWKPTVGLDEGLERCVKWHFENKDLMDQISLD